MMTRDDVNVTHNRNGSIELSAIHDGYRQHCLVILFDDDSLDDAIDEWVSHLVPNLPTHRQETQS